MTTVMTTRQAGPQVKMDDYMDNDPTVVQGVNNLVTWFIHSGKTQIHIAKANIRDARFDISIIPVDVNLYGPGPGLYDIKQNYNDLMPYKKKYVVGGDVVWTLQQHDFVCKEVALAVVVDLNADTTTANDNWFKVVRDVLREVATRKVCTVGIMINDSYDVIQFVRALVEHRNGGQEENVCVFLCSQCKTTNLTTIVRDIDQIIQTMKLPRRLVSMEMREFLPRLKIGTKIHRGSLLDTGCQSVVAAVGQDLNLKQGGITKYIADAAGEETATYIQNQKGTMEYWKVIRCPSGRLSEEGIVCLLFGCVPKWGQTEGNVLIPKLLAKFIFGCLLMADENGCSSIAIPLIGTGRLNYPERTVFASILDGIELYAQLATIQNITEVVIAFPNIDNDCYQMYVSELKRRENSETKLLFRNAKVKFLSSANTPTRYAIVKVQDLQNQLPIEFVEVELNNNSDKAVDVHYQMNKSKLRIQCEINEHNFEDVVRRVGETCVTERITNLVIYTSCLPTISAVAQMEGIIDAFESYKHKHVYLYRVLVVVSNTEELMSCNNALKKRSKHNVECITAQNTVNVGPIWRTKEVCDFKLDDSVYIVNANPGDIESAETNAHSQDSDMDMDMVTAEINLGVTQYLRTKLLVENWKRTIKTVFNVRVFETNGTMMLEGSFDNILKVETYLEKDFPNEPIVGQATSDQGMSFHSSHDVIVELNKGFVQKKTMKQASYKQLENTSVDPNRHNMEQGVKCSVTKKTNGGATKTKTEIDPARSTFSNKLSSVPTVPISTPVDVAAFTNATKDKVDAVDTVKIKGHPMNEPPNTQSDKTWKDPLRTDSTKDSSSSITRNRNDSAKNVTTHNHSPFVKTSTHEQRNKPKEAIDTESHTISYQDFDSFHTDKGKPYRINNLFVYVYQKDITTVPTDALVCTDDPSFKHTTGLSQYISSRAGKGCIGLWLQLASREQLQSCMCIPTHAGQLHYKRIIHVIRPKEPGTIHKAFNNVLLLCEETITSSVALPTIGAGTWPKQVHKCAEQYYQALQEFGGSTDSKTPLSEIHIVDTSKSRVHMVRSVFDRMLNVQMDPISTSDDDAIDISTYEVVDEGRKGPARLKTMKETANKHLEKAVKDPPKNVPKQDPSNTTGTAALATHGHGTYVKTNIGVHINKQREKFDQKSHKNAHQEPGCFYPDKGKKYRINKMSVYIYRADITTVSTDTLVCTDDPSFTHTKGLSQYISSRAGKDCVEEWLQIASRQKIQNGMCIPTPAGQLNYSSIFHVIRPTERDTIHKAFYNILHQCDTSNISSVVIPMIGAGTWKNNVHDCADQYYRALQTFGGSTASKAALSEIHLVDVTQTTIDTVRSVFDRRMTTISPSPIIAPSDCFPFSIFSSTVAVTKQGMFSFRTDVKVLTTNNHFTEELEYTKEALRRCPTFNAWFDSLKGHRLGCSDIRCKCVSENNLYCQYVIVAVRPWPPKPSDQDRMRVFIQDVRTTVKNIMEKVQQLKMVTVAIPLIINSDNREVRDACCEAMVNEMISFAQSSADLTVHVVTDDKNYDLFRSVLERQLHSGPQVTRV